jgi:hypothetical protein
VEREAAGGGDAGAFDGGAEGLPGGAVVEAASVPVAEDEIIGPFVVGGEPVLAELGGECGGEDDFASAAGCFERAVEALAGQLTVNVDQPCFRGRCRPR